MMNIELSSSILILSNLAFINTHNLEPTHTQTERGKAGVHKPQHLSLLCHIVAFLYSGSVKPQPFQPFFHATTFESFGNYNVFKC